MVKAVATAVYIPGDDKPRFLTIKEFIDWDLLNESKANIFFSCTDSFDNLFSAEHSGN